MNTVRVRTIGENDVIALKDVLDAQIHPAIKAYFRAEVEKLLQEERTKEMRSKRFPYGLPEVTGLQRQIDLLLINHYEFDQPEFESLLDSAVHFEFNFLCRPQWTLLEFMFEGRRTLGVSEAMRKFKYCVEYTYFAELFRRYIVDRGLAELSYEEFKNLIAKIDAEIVSRHSSTELARLLRPMLEFLEVGIPETRVSESGPALPINAAVVFFEDKRLDDIQKALEAERDGQGKTEISLNDLARVIVGIRKDEILEPVQAHVVPFEVEKPVESKVAEPAKETAPAAPPAAAPSVVKVPAPRESPAPAEPRKSQPKPKKTDAKGLADVYTLFTLKEQKLFVRKLFQKDEVAFRNALDRLNPIPVWQEASFVLDEIFTANNVDPFSREAIRLTDKLYERYAAVGQERT